MTPRNKLLRCASDVLNHFTLPRQFKTARTGFEPASSFYLLSFGREGRIRTADLALIRRALLTNWATPLCKRIVIYWQCQEPHYSRVKIETWSGSVYPLSHFSALSTWRSTVLFFICVQTSYELAFLCIGGRRGSRNHTRFDSLLLVFKTSPLPLGLVSHIQVWVFVPDTVSFGAFKDRYDCTIRCTQTLFLIVDSSQMRFHLREFHLLCRRINDSWQRILDSN